MLDDQKSISKIDKSNMLEAVELFPDQIKKTIDIIDSVKLGRLYKIDNIVISGMGGSAISGDILQSYLRDTFKIPVFVNRKYDLPKWTNKNTLLFSQSYSGNTEETLSAFKQGVQKNCKIIAISSGGKLQKLCENHDISHIKIPSGLQPRAATAYLLFSSLLSLKKVGLLKNNIQNEIKETISVAENLKKNNKKSVPEEKNHSKQIARKLFRTIPQVYGWGFYESIARRWCQQFNENSKVICRYDKVSECNHNDIVGWSKNPKFSKNFTCILFRDKKNESLKMSERLDFMKKLYDDVAAKVVEIDIPDKKRLPRMMYAMYLGDYISCYLAILRKIDPSPVEVIDELKNRLDKI